MKKLIAMVMAVVISICVVSFPAFATDVEHENSFGADPMIAAASPFARESLTEYLQTIPVMQAQRILGDREMLVMMLMDSYWAPAATVAQPRAYTGIISGYESGKYYNWTGKSCTCHLSCNNVKTRLDYCQKKDGTSGNCKRYNPTGAIQCKGFADMAFKEYKGSDASASNAISTFPSYGNDGSGVTSVTNFFKNTLTTGSNIRVHVRGKDYNHSFIFGGMTADGKGFKIYHANGGTNQCQIEYGDMQFSTFVSKYDYFIGGWKV